MGKAEIKRKYQEALDGLAQNKRTVFGYDRPVLIEGGAYSGIWLESGPLEGLVYGRLHPEVARANHDIFFRMQRDDGGRTASGAGVRGMRPVGSMAGSA